MIGFVQQEINVNIRIDTHFDDIYGFMNVALVGATGFMELRQQE